MKIAHKTELIFCTQFCCLVQNQKVVIRVFCDACCLFLFGDLKILFASKLNTKMITSTTMKVFALVVCSIFNLSIHVLGANNSPNGVDMNDIDAEEIFQTINNAIKLGQWQNKIETDIESLEMGMDSI